LKQILYGDYNDDNEDVNNNIKSGGKDNDIGDDDNGVQGC
jgi:hypothetical protein